jgi:TPR repeat protein
VGAIILLMALVAESPPTLEQLKKRCNQGQRASCFKVAMSYDMGVGVPRDLREAAYWHERACALGAAPSCYNLAVMYEKGEGVSKDAGKAARFYAEEIRLLEKSCKEGLPDACRMLESKRTNRESPAPGPTPADPPQP